MFNNLSKTGAKLLITYCVAGAVCGMFVGALMAGVEFGCCELESRLTADRWRRRLDLHDLVFALTLSGMVLGFAFAVIWRIAAMVSTLWSHPFCAASMGASMVGCFWFLIIPECYPQWLESPLVPVLLAHLICTLGLGALYGLLLSLLVRAFRRWFVDDRSRPLVR